MVGGLLPKEKAAEAYRLTIPLGLDEFSPQIPKDNPLTNEKVELGRLLFFDKRISIDERVSCASCHNPKLAFTDSQPVSSGFQGQKGKRNTPTIINRLFSSGQFWDGRADSLEEQVKAPLINPVEMANPSHEGVVGRLKKIPGYPPLFKTAFGTEAVTMDHIAKAIASFERTVVSGNSPFDRFETGGDKKALSESAWRGLKVFRGKGQCHLCHTGFNLTDELYHNLGAGWAESEKDRDLGRYAVTRKEEDKGKFKTPTLREIEKTGPYMHDGSLRTLEEVIDFYDRGGNKNPNLDFEMRPLKLTPQEKRDLLEFLRSLSGAGWQKIMPPARFPE
ncbi:MAG: cytochrome-c peroxidase [Acidobacteria bacterium]|nr:cytochrome-c peroxidase [Acidobacteriota bacterium]MBI3654955.1 cytochrome-c peroxidase [Acidobacteriota bacterium]